MASAVGTSRNVDVSRQDRRGRLGRLGDVLPLRRLLAGVGVDPRQRAADRVEQELDLARAEGVGQAVARGLGAGGEHDRAAPEPLADEGVEVAGRRQIEGEGVAAGPRRADQVRERPGDRVEARPHQLLDPGRGVAGRHHLGVDATAHQGRVVGAGRLGILEARHDHADLGPLGEDHRVGVVGLAAAGQQAELGVPGERATEAEAALHLVEDERDLVVAGQEAEAAEEPRGGVAIAALGLHRLDGDDVVLAAGQGGVDRGQAGDLGGQSAFSLASPKRSVSSSRAPAAHAA
jgi:hypothetical protein